MIEWTSERLALLGTVSDRDLAYRIGCSRGAVWMKRVALGITSARGSREPTPRILSRRAAQAWSQMSSEGRALYERAARRLEELDMTPAEFALEMGLDVKLLWRTRQATRGDARRFLWAVAA